MLAKGKGLVRGAYLKRVVAERLTGKRQEGFSNQHTERGTEQEPLARMAYAAETGNMIEQVGFIKHPSLMAGCSPDGTIDDTGGLEIKCVLPTVQIETIEKGGYPVTHRPPRKPSPPPSQRAASGNTAHTRRTTLPTPYC